MPNIKSAKKRVLVAETKNLRNRMIKSALKTEIKKFDAAVESGNVSVAEEELKTASGALDKAAIKGVIHKNKADRTKAQIAKKFAAMK